MVIMTPVSINGTDISSYIAFRGIKWSRRYVNGRNGGITLAGYTQLDVLAQKSDLSITCVPLTYSDLQTLRALLAAPSVKVIYDDPDTGTGEKEMHPDARGASFLNEDGIDASDVTMMWDGISFKLEEL